MKTVFKKGMKVYDQVNFPDKEGEIIRISDFPCPIIVEFECEEYSYRLNGSFQLGAKPTLSTKPYEVELKGFEQKAPAPTFEEAWNNSHNSKEIFYSSNCDKVCSGYPTQELADASEALRRLLFLRDYYNEGWQPDWSKKDKKYCIEYEETSISPIDHICNSRIMTFKTPEIRDKFLEEQRELLEIAKPLL